MIVTCERCKAQCDDEFLLTICPHDTFLANDGLNNFAHHPESTLIKPIKRKVVFHGCSSSYLHLK